MRKIKTMTDAERVRRRNNIIFGVMMIGLLVFASLGYSLMSADVDGNSEVVEMGLEFVRVNGVWKTLIGESVFSFQYLPSEVRGVDVDVSVDFGDYSGKVLYFVDSNEGVGEVLRNIGGYVLRYQEACVDDGVERDCGEDLPVKSCSDNLIIFASADKAQEGQVGNETRVYGDGGCVYIIGDSVRGVDAFLYDVLGIF